MTSVLMLARLRTLLDEASASFWTDTEAYAALSDGQRAVTDILFAKNRNHHLLKPLLKQVEGSDAHSYDITLPTDFKEFINATYCTVTTEDKFPCEIKDYNTDFLTDKDNTYLTPIRMNPVVYINATTSLGRKIYFEPSSLHSDYIITYLTQPTEIDGSTQPLLPAETQESMILYAFSFLLRKDMRAQEADGVYKLFLEMTSKL